MAKKRPTDEEMAIRASELVNDADIESSHGNTDELMEELLIQLGYPSMVGVIRDSERWYA